MKSYIPKAKEEEQLTEWLEELKELRNITASHLYAVAFNRGYLKAEKEVRNKAIEDFADKIISLCDDGEFMNQFNEFTATTILEIAEQLKVGGENGKLSV